MILKAREKTQLSVRRGKVVVSPLVFSASSDSMRQHQVLGCDRMEDVKRGKPAHLSLHLPASPRWIDDHPRPCCVCSRRYQAFPSAIFKFSDGSGKPLTPGDVRPPFRLSFSEMPANEAEAAAGRASADAGGPKELITVTPYVLPNPGPYPQVQEVDSLVGRSFQS